LESFSLTGLGEVVVVVAVATDVTPEQEVGERVAGSSMSVLREGR
jgi:hypothetical protein